MEKRVCIDCGEEKDLENFYKANKTGNSRYRRCKICHNKRRQQWPMSGTTPEYQRNKYRELRNQIIEFLGGKCVGCGYDENVLGLDIDHVDNDGKLARTRKNGKTKKGSNATDLKRMLDNNCEGLQLLCGTCHNIKTRTYNLEIGLYK